MVVAKHNKFLISRQLDRIEIIKRVEMVTATINSMVEYIGPAKYDDLEPLYTHVSNSRAALDSIEDDLLLLDHLSQPNMNLGELISELELLDPELEIISDFKEQLSLWALLSSGSYPSHATIQTHHIKVRGGRPEYSIIKVRQITQLLKSSLDRKLNTFHTKKDYFIRETTPLWLGSEYGESGLRCLISVDKHEDMVVLRTQ